MTTIFIDYLSEVHANGYTGTDDNMPDAFDNWLENMDTSELIDYADLWASELIDKSDLLNV